MRNKCFAMLAVAVLVGVSAQAKSGKRGVCWDEDRVSLNDKHARLMRPGVSWVYNWGPDAANAGVYDADFAFVPMAWNGAYDASRIRAWIAAHPETKYLLAFNEPNFADQARMTPSQAAAAWPGLEQIAAEYGLKLVAPALNFSNSQVGGRIWTPYEWYDEFFRLVPDADIECLAMHCYMNWYSATAWLATEYFYADLYTPGKECYGRYPNLVGFLDRYKLSHGHFPRMMLTEFCSWENDGTIGNVDFQIDQMTQKVQKLEQSDLVEGYAWFIANSGDGAAAYPYMSLFSNNSADSGLSALGEVYVHMSTFDTGCYYADDTMIQAKDYVDATTDDRSVRVRPNSESATVADVPLQIEIPASGYPEYLIEASAAGTYNFRLHVSAPQQTAVTLYVDMKRTHTVTVHTGSGIWTDVGIETELEAGRHSIMLYNSGGAPLFINKLGFTATDGTCDAVVNSSMAKVSAIYTIQGLDTRSTDTLHLTPGVYVVRMSDGSCIKYIKK